ncbi:trafficking kinesin-binding protein 1-like isoform X1 [Lytechinus pictus]|uniref:trafficking kinesin-binding protein 1-like isoform X1 n=1 Tax=Lytechinus pictus TaxID=7653 RepID=UPI0030B9B9C0
MEYSVTDLSMKDEWDFIHSYLYDCLEIGELYSLCGDRVVQMTKTYNDIDAVTKLLEEKEKDLELAAKIGQSLLQQNKQLEGRIELTEEQLTIIADQNTQFRHDLKLKDELLNIYTNDVDQSDSEDESIWNEKGKGSIQSKYINIDNLQKKIKNLEEENLHLRIETAELRTTTSNIEEKEEELVRDCFRQLRDSRGTCEILTDELSKKFEENMRQQEEITSLLAQLVDLQHKVKKLSVENEEMSRHLTASKEAQQDLVKDLIETKEKYEEVYTMFQEAQETAKKSNRSSMSHGGIGFGTYLNPLPVFPADSLAAELVDCVEQRLEKDPHLSKKGKREYNKNVMKTVKVVNKRSHNSPGSGYSSDFYSRPVSPSSSVISLVGSEMCEGDSESINSSHGSGLHPPVSCIPGSNDLATALRRLKLRRENETAEKDYAELHMNSPTCPSPDSMLSGLSGSTVPIGGAGGGQSFRAYMPEKLQIVKPMEGSMALHHWQRLATPHIASMLDSRPGVVVKGFREIDTRRDSFLDEIEDDGCVQSATYPSKGFAHTSSTFTYTTSRLGQTGDTFMTSRNPAGTRMTIDLQETFPGVYDPPPGASLGLASVLATPQVTSGSAVRLKASQTGAVGGAKSKRSSVGLNFLSTSPNSEKKAELDVEAPSGVHKVSGQIFSRNASPMSSISSGIKILDPDTKARLMEKVKSIRAEKAAQKATMQRQLLVTTNAVMLAPSLAVSIPRTTVGLGGMMMSSSTSASPRMSSFTTGSEVPSAISGLNATSSSATPRIAGGPSMNVGLNEMMMSSSSMPRMSSQVGAPNGLSSSLGGMVMSSSTTPRMSTFSNGSVASGVTPSGSLSSIYGTLPGAPTTSIPSGATTVGSSHLSSTPVSFPGGLMSPGSSFPPILGQSRGLASPMSILAASRPVTATTSSTETTTAGLGQALEPSGLGTVLGLLDSPKAKTVITKTKTKVGMKKL